LRLLPLGKTVLLLIFLAALLYITDFEENNAFKSEENCHGKSIQEEDFDGKNIKLAMPGSFI